METTLSLEICMGWTLGWLLCFESFEQSQNNTFYAMGRYSNSMSILGSRFGKSIRNGLDCGWTSGRRTSGASRPFREEPLQASLHEAMALLGHLPARARIHAIFESEKFLVEMIDRGGAPAPVGGPVQFRPGRNR